MAKPSGTITTGGVTAFLDLFGENGMSGLPARFSILLDRAHFADEVLDVTALFPFADPSKCKIRFGALPSDLYEISRIMARVQLLGGAAPATVQAHLNCLKNFFAELYKTSDVMDFRFLTTDDIRMTLKMGHWSNDSCQRICTALYRTFAAAHAVYDSRMLRVDLDELELMRSRYAARTSHGREARKTQDFDDEYFEILDARLPRLARDEKLPINYRMTAAMEMLRIWTGLRNSEPFTLTTDSLTFEKDTKGREIPYLTYVPEKLSHGGSKRVSARTVALPGAETAFNLLLELRKRIPGYGATDRLFILDGPNNVRTGFRYYVDRMFKDCLPDLVLRPWESISKRTVGGTTIRVPSATQFRVHLCSWLYHNGVSLAVIEIGMSHMLSAMHAYYVRIKDKTFADENRRMDNVVRTTTNNDFDIEVRPEHGETLLMGLVIAVKRLEVFTEQYEEMKRKGYEYEVMHYGNIILALLTGEIRPTVSYLERVLQTEGRDAVLDRHPMLRRIIDELDNYKQTFHIWQERTSKRH